MENTADNFRKVLLVDDEPSARKLLRAYLADYCPGHQVVGEAGDVEAAFRLVRETQPDLVFLDVELAGSSCFELLDMLPRIDFSLVFTTAHDEFALRAFRYAAVDYMLKPIAPEDFARAVDRATLAETQHIQHLLKILKAPSNPAAFEKIALPSLQGITMMALRNIIRLESDSGYTTFLTADGERCLVSRSVGDFEEILPPANFLRVHTSHLINLDFVKKFLREDGGFALMDDGAKVPIARRRKDIFLEMLRARSLC